MHRSAEYDRRMPTCSVARWTRALACLATVWMGAAAMAQVANGPIGPVGGEPASAKDLRGWLVRIQEAPSRRNFQGTFVVTAGGAVSSARIVHYHGAGSQYERIESLDGKARQVYRHDDLIHTFWPENRIALIEQRAKPSSFPALLQAGDDRIVELYDVRLQGIDRVAGHEAHVLSLSPRDAFRFGYRLWADKDSGLLLRADVLGERGELLESSAFSDVVIGVRSQPEVVLQAMKKLDGYRVARPILAPTQLEQEGWVQRQLVPGFRMVSCVKRSLSAAGEVESVPSPPPVLQAIFSDGLTHVSVFIEPYNVQRHQRPMLTSIGATHTLMVRQGEWWFTVVGDVPGAALRAFAKGIERLR